MGDTGGDERSICDVWGVEEGRDRRCAVPAGAGARRHAGSGMGSHEKTGMRRGDRRRNVGGTAISAVVSVGAVI